MGNPEVSPGCRRATLCSSRRSRGESRGAASDRSRSANLVARFAADHDLNSTTRGDGLGAARPCQRARERPLEIGRLDTGVTDAARPVCPRAGVSDCAHRIRGRGRRPNRISRIETSVSWLSNSYGSGLLPLKRIGGLAPSPGPVGGDGSPSHRSPSSMPIVLALLLRSRHGLPRQSTDSRGPGPYPNCTPPTGHGSPTPRAQT